MNNDASKTDALDIDPDAYVTDGIPRKEDSYQAHMFAAQGGATKPCRDAYDRHDELTASLVAWDRKYPRRAC
jgi:hypothetical protein